MIFVIVGVVGEERQTLVRTIEDLHHLVHKNLTLTTNYLITTSDNTSETKKKAQNMKTVQIITPDQFNNLFLPKKRTNNEDLSEKQPTTPPKKKQKTTVELEQVNVETPQRQSSTRMDTNEDIDPSIIKTHPIPKLRLIIPFVNRSKESQEIAQLLLDQKSLEKGPLPILSQHFGSGKSSIVKNFRNVIERENVTLTSSLEGNVESLMKASLIIILLGKLSCSVQEKLQYLFGTITIAIRNEVAKNNMIDESLKQKSTLFAQFLPIDGITQTSTERSKSSLFYFLEEWSNNSLAPLILFFDESGLKDQELAEFWDYFFPLFGSSYPICNNVFFITAGKTSSLTKMGRGMNSNSPLHSKHIILNMLEIKYIQELIDKTTFSSIEGITMKHFLQKCCHIEDMEYFVKILYEYTGGIPRLVVTVFDSFIKYITSGKTLELRTRKAISSIFADFKDNLVFEPITHLAEIRPIATPHLTSREFKLLYYRSVVGLPLLRSDSSRIDLIHEMNVAMEYINIEERAFYKIIVPKFVLLSGPILPTRITILRGTFSQNFPLSQVTDKGSLLEILVRDSLIFTILGKKQSGSTILFWKDIHTCFAQSNLLSDKKVSMDEPYVKYMPKIVTAKSTKDITIEELKEMQLSPWGHELSDRNWPKIKKIFFEGNRIIHPGPKSRSSDLYFYLPPMSLLAFAIKNYPKTKFKFTTLQEEIDKAALAMQDKEITDVSLFVFCNGIQNSIVNKYCNTNNCLVLKSGIHELANNLTKTLSKEFTPIYKLLRETPSLIKQYSSDFSMENTSILYVPNGMEVIVVGEDAFNSFFSEQDKQFLDSLADLDVKTTDYTRVIQEYNKLVDETLDEV